MDELENITKGDEEIIGNPGFGLPEVYGTGKLAGDKPGTVKVSSFEGGKIMIISYWGESREYERLKLFLGDICQAEKGIYYDDEIVNMEFKKSKLKVENKNIKEIYNYSIEELREFTPNLYLYHPVITKLVKQVFERSLNSSSNEPILQSTLEGFLNF